MKNTKKIVFYMATMTISINFILAQFNVDLSNATETEINLIKIENNYYKEN